MQKVLRKRILRDLKENLFRYLALSALIIFVMYLIVSIVGAADTIIIGSEKQAEKNQLEDGQFGVFVPLTDTETEKLEKKGVRLEKQFYLDFGMEDHSTLRVYQNREEIDLIALEEGKLAQTEDEIVLEKRYCEEKDLHVGDSIILADATYKIVGIGSTPDYDAPLKQTSDTTADSSIFGTAFVTADTYDMLRKSGKSEKTEEYVYAYRLPGNLTNAQLKEELKKLEFSAEDVKDTYFQEYWDQTMGKKDDLENGINDLVDGANELRDGLSELQDYSDDLNDGADEIFDAYLDEANKALKGYGIQEVTADNFETVLNDYVNQSNDPGARMVARGARMQLQELKSYVDGTKEYTDGAKEAADGSEELADGVRELKDNTDDIIDDIFDVDVSNMTYFLVAEDNPRVLGAAGDQEINKIGGLIGFSKWGIGLQMQDCFGFFSLPVPAFEYTPYLIVYTFVMPALTAAIVNCLVIRKKLSRPVLSMLRKEQKASRIRDLNLGNMGFIARFRIRQMLREMRSAFAVVFGMFVSMLIVMMGLDIYVMCQNVNIENKADTKFAYMYTYKYPTEEVPDGGEEAFGKTLKKERLGYNLDVTLLGIHDDNPYFDAKVEDGKNKIVISTAVAQKYNVGEGDVFVLNDEETDTKYAFDIVGIAQYSSSLYIFMDIDSMRELFHEGSDYYNIVFSDKDLSIPSGRLYATTTKEDVEEASGIFIKMMWPMIYMLLGCSVIIFCVVMYLMMKVMIDRSSFHISLIKIFGYRTKEIGKLYLRGNFYLVAAGALICIPLAKACMDAIYPMLVANVCSGMNLTFSWQLYAGIYAAVILLYLLINQLLVGRLKKMVPAEVLKNRE